MKLQVAFSPCPNDTFIFDALIHQKVDTEGIEFEAVLADVETLNLWAFEKRYPITKLSYHAWCHLVGEYQLLSAGSALGRGVGPLLIAKKPLTREEILAGQVAIPGQYTTAHFLCNLAYPGIRNKRMGVFSEIEQLVLDGEVQAGVIIHENRFTYAQKGLVKIQDLGEWWENHTQSPIPLGGIAIRRDWPLDLRARVARVLKRSVEYAFAHPTDSQEYVAAHAQEMDAAVRQQHIALYVNDFSVDLGQEGLAAVQKLYEMASERNLLKHTFDVDYLLPTSLKNNGL